MTTHDHFPEFSHLERRIGLGSICLQSRWTEYRYRLWQSAAESLPTMAHIIPVKFLERCGHEKREVYLWESIRMGTDDGHIARPRFRVAEGDVLLHCQFRNISIAISCRCNVVSGVAAINGMLDHSVR